MTDSKNEILKAYVVKIAASQRLDPSISAGRVRLVSSLSGKPPMYLN